MFASPSEAQTSSPDQAIARIGSEVIYDEALRDLIGSQLWQLRSQEYDLKRVALEFLVNQRLLEADAKSNGLSTEALLEQVVYKTLAPPSASDVEAYYLGQKDRINQPFNDVKAQLEKGLVQARKQQARQDYIDQLRKKSSIAILLQKPKMEATVDPARLRGDPDAPVTIVEFSDFQCPYCQVAQATVREVMEKYKGKVRLGYRDLPLRQIHQQAQQAAEASRCAAEQGKFWEYHDLLFSGQQLDASSLTAHASKVGLDVERFEGCVKSEKYKPMVENDLQMGMKAGVTGTPAFFVNGQLLSGNQPLGAFEKIIDEELAAGEPKKQAQSNAAR
jgi:protein-disulfide isomerase